MSELSRAQERTICSMYREGASLRTLEVAFGMEDEEIIRVLLRGGVVQQREDESWEALVQRVREDVGHAAAA